MSMKQIMAKLNTDNCNRIMKDTFGVDLSKVNVYNHQELAKGFIRAFGMLHLPYEEAIFKTDNPEIKVVEMRDSYLKNKLVLARKDPRGDDSCFYVPLETILIPNRKRVTIDSKLSSVRRGFYFGPDKECEDAQGEPNMHKNISHAFEYVTHYVNGKKTHTLCIFDEDVMVEERVIEESEAPFMDNANESRKLVIRKTEDGAKVSVQYEVKD